MFHFLRIAAAAALLLTTTPALSQGGDLRLTVLPPQSHQMPKPWTEEDLDRIYDGIPDFFAAARERGGLAHLARKLQQEFGPPAPPAAPAGFEE